MLYFSGLQKLSGKSAALISYLDPVSALLFSAFFLHEVMTPVQAAGAVLIIGGAMFGEIKNSGNNKFKVVGEYYDRKRKDVGRRNL